MLIKLKRSGGRGIQFKLGDNLKGIIMKSLLLSSARAIAINAINILSRIAFPGSKKFWENRYSKGGTSGYGSYGKLAEYNH